MDAALLTELRIRALNVRRDVVRMMGMARTGHMASSLSAADILVWLYGAVLSVYPEDPLREERDRFVLSRASVSPALYAVLAERGFFKRDELWGYRRLGSTLQAFADFRRTPGIDVSCGSPGMGPGISLGLALALKNRDPDVRVFCLVGDAELREGAVWEALITCAHHRTGNLTLIVDKNNFQPECETEKTPEVNPLGEKFETFGWAVACANGHDMADLNRAFLSLPLDRARVLIAGTVRGRGIPSLEHGTSNDKLVLDRQLTDELLKELEGQADDGNASERNEAEKKS